MKINYEFVDGNKVEIEVSEEWAEIIIELDRVDYNNYQKERKKHFSLQAIGKDLAIYDPEEPEVCVLHKGKYIEIPNESIIAALNNLTDKQKDLIEHIYFKGMSAREYAHKRGLKECTVSISHAAALKKLKKYFDKRF